MITIVVGKPGAGKSYDTVSRLAENLIDRVNRSAELPVVVTNLKLNIDAFREYVSKNTRRDVDLNIEILSDDDLSQPFWWRNLPPDSLIILDESQFYWSSRRIDPAEQQNLIETLSTHRHRRQDFILLTQSLTSLSVDIRKYCENVIEVLNAKSLTLPFPISIPLRDVQILAAAFGSRRQIYRTREGLLEGTYKVAWDGELKICKTCPKIYALYRSTDSEKQGDNALPFADGPGMWRRGLKWFLFKHGGAILIKLTIVVVPVIMILSKMYGVRSATASLSPIKKNVVSVDSSPVITDKKISMEINPYKIVGQGWAIDEKGNVINGRGFAPRESGGVSQPEP